VLSLGKTSSSSFEGRVLAMHAVACFGRGHEAEFAEATKARAAVCVVGGVVVVGDGCLVCVWCAVWSVRFGNEEARIIEIMMEKVAALEKVDRSCFFFQTKTSAAASQGRKTMHTHSHNPHVHLLFRKSICFSGPPLPAAARPWAQALYRAAAATRRFR